MMMGGDILVTGGAGYIGSHICKALAADGYTPVVFDNFSTGWREAVKFGPLIEGDLCDPDAIAAAIHSVKPRAVMHFAAASLVGEAAQNPGKYWQNNLVGTLNLLNAMVAHDVRNIVFSSTCAVYGDQDGLVLNEDSPKCPLNAYGASKAAIEDMITNFTAAHALGYVVFRYFNVAGADPSAIIGEQHRPETHLIPLVFDAITGKIPALDVYGDDYNTPDGTPIRDYIHVMDIAHAHIAGLNRLLLGGAAGIFNLGAGRGASVKDVINTAQTVTGHTVPYHIKPRRPGDASALLSGSKRAESELNWRPENSSLETIISDAWRWYQSPSFKS